MNNNQLWKYNLNPEERTLADKYFSMIYWGESSSREKDFEDLNRLFKDSNKELLWTISKNYWY